MMTFKMSDLKGIDEGQVAQLRKGGVETTEDMMQSWVDTSKRASLVASTNLTEEQLTRLASMARLARMRGIGPKYAALLVTAGVRGRKSLATFTPEALMKHLADVSAAKSLSGPMPTLAEVGTWFADPATETPDPAPAG